MNGNDVTIHESPEELENPPKTAENNTERVDWKNVWKFILGMKIEFVFLFYALPGYINFIGLELLPIEKACRINLHYPDMVCKNLNNGLFKESCGDIYEYLAEERDANETEIGLQELLKKIGVEKNIPISDVGILKDVCIAETEAQKLKVEVNTDRAPFGYLALIVIIFAGPLGDKYNRKKPFLLLPMLGELITDLAYLTTSVFKTAVPMEFHLILERVVYSLSGGYSLLLMGVFSFLAATTIEEQRTFRFGVFSLFSAGLGIIIQPMATYAFEEFGYVNLFLFCALIHFCGIIYIVCCIDEVTPNFNKEKEIEDQDSVKIKDDIENIKYEIPISENTVDSRYSIESITSMEKIDEKPDSKLKMISELVNLFISNFKVFHVIRPFSGRAILAIAMIGYGFLCITNGEPEVSVLFGREAWGWTTEFAFFQSYTTFVAFVGTLIVTGVLITAFHIADAILVMLSIVCSLVAKSIFAFTRDFYIIYLAATIEMFNSTRVIAIRSLLSKIVAADELGRIYSVMSVMETLINPISSIIYNQTYQETIQSFPGTFYFLTISAFFIMFLIYLRVNTLIKPLLEMFNETTEEMNDTIDEKFNETIEISRL